VINTVATGTRPVSQETPQINISSWVTEGMDYEVSYRFAMDDAIDWGLGGDVTLRMLATNVMSFRQDPGFDGAAISQVAGANANGGIAAPHWKVFLNQAYDTDTWGLFVNERWFSEGRSTATGWPAPPPVRRRWMATIPPSPATICRASSISTSAVTMI
jgi:hypothetical protein